MLNLTAWALFSALQITGTPAQAPAANAISPRSLPSDGIAVFLADRETDGLTEIWASHLDGSPPGRVSGTLAPGASLTNTMWVAPDRQHVAYLGTQIPGEYGLYAATIDGTSFAKVSATGQSLQTSAQDSIWSPDGQWIAYRSKAGSGASIELWVVRPDGTERRQISNVTVLFGNVLTVQWSPDSSRVGFIGDLETDGKNELYTATPDGSTVDRVNVPLASDGDIHRFVWSPDGSWIACEGRVSSSSGSGLFTSRPDGVGFASATHAHTILSPLFAQFAWTPEGERLVLVATAADANVLELWSVARNGTGWTKLSGMLPALGGVREFRIAPDGSRVAYRADQTLNDREELYTTRLDGTDNVAISGPFVSGGAVSLSDAFFWSPDSSKIAYMADQQVNNRMDVFVAQPDGSGNVKVSGQFHPNDNAGLELYTPWTAQSNRLAYVEYNFGTHPISVRPDGTGAVKVVGPAVAGTGSSAGVWSPDGRRIVFRSSRLTFGVFELFAANPDGSDIQRLSGTLVADGDVSSIWVVR